MTLTLHEDSESEMVLHGKSKVWLKYYIIIFQIANKTRKENLKPQSNDISVVSAEIKERKKINQNTSAQKAVMDY